MDPAVASPRRRWRALVPRAPVLALLLLAPSIPELLTGSTPITPLVTDPIGFAVSFGLDIALYGTGALLIREFVVAYRKGWASTLLLGAAYGVGEEGFAVHTFFQRSGAPVGVLGTYGHAFGVNWLWALGLSTFHATYSISLPILLTQLWFPSARTDRWFGRTGVATIAAVYVGVVSLLGLVVGHGPTPAAFAFFVGVSAVLLGLAAALPANFLSVPSGRSRLGPWGLALLGTGGFDAWVLELLLSSNGRLPAVVSAALFVAIDLAIVLTIRRSVGSADLEWSQFYFATGMLAALFVWDIPLEFSVPGILGVAALFAWLQYRLARRIGRRARGPGLPAGVAVPGSGG